MCHLEDLKTPVYILSENLLRSNLCLIKSIEERAGVEFILAFKAYALWRTFPIFREYIRATTASSLYEARLSYEEFHAKAHTYSPAYKDDEIAQIAQMSSHLTFNSLSQYSRLAKKALEANPALSLGLRINPERSEVKTLLYNPCAAGTRFGVTKDKLPERLPQGIDGLHCHCHCESSSEEFVRSLCQIERLFSPWFKQIKWINFGGGHLVTRQGYNTGLLIQTLRAFHERHPYLEIILEPGSAFAWQTGVLVASVVDIVEDKGIKTAILDVSFTCHMPDCLEMPYMPEVRGAETLSADSTNASDPCTYRLGGNSCLSGDFLGYWRFPEPLTIGQKLVFEDMIHYTTVKTTMFNGISHPSIALLDTDNNLHVLRQFTYGDYRDRMC